MHIYIYIYILCEGGCYIYYKIIPMEYENCASISIKTYNGLDKVNI